MPAILQPAEQMLSNDQVTKSFQALVAANPQMGAGIARTDIPAMRKALEAANAKAALNNDPNAPEQDWANMLQTNLGQIEQMNGNAANTVASKVFNLKKYAQGGFAPATPTDPFGAEANPAGMAAEQGYNAMQQDPNGEMQQSQIFNDAAQLKNELDQCSQGGLNQLQAMRPDVYAAFMQSEQSRGLIKRYWDIESDNDRLQAAQGLYKFLPANLQSNQPDNTPEDGMNVPANLTQADVGEYLNRITASIKEVADQVGAGHREKKASTFNLKKTAQHQTGGQAIMWGPAQVRPDPFLRGQPVSDWHIIERNKGFGRDIDGVWNIDWEAVWRGNVMDKYSRPYRDTKTGEWVGGYIQKRFEVDKNIPETNNYQLLPGERRKPYLPEYGSTEARLQAMRNKDDGHLGRVFNDTTKPFNWKEASAKGLTKTAAPRTNHPVWMEQGDPEADAVVEQAMGSEPDYTDIINDDLSRANTPVETSVPLGDDRDPVLADLLRGYNPQATAPGLSPNESGDLLDARGLTHNQVGNEDVATRMKARQMTRDMAGIGNVASAATPVTTGEAPVDTEAQTDVTTEKQLANVAQRPGVFGLPSIQRHNQPEPDLEEGSGYTNNYGDEIKDKSATSGLKIVMSKEYQEVVKKKSKANRSSSAVKKAWLNEGRPQENPLDKPLTLPGEKAPKANFDTEHFCPRCGSQISPHGGNSKSMLAGPGGVMVAEPNKCPNCHFQISDKTTDSGLTQKQAPDSPKPKIPTPGTNVRLNEVLFDARTRRFIIAKSEDPDPSFMTLRDTRREFFPHKQKDLPRTNPDIPGREFKQMRQPQMLRPMPDPTDPDRVTLNFDAPISNDPTKSMLAKPMLGNPEDYMDQQIKADNVTKSCTDLAIDG